MCRSAHKSFRSSFPLGWGTGTLEAAGFAWGSFANSSRAVGVGVEGPLTVRTRWGSPSAALDRQLHRCSTGGAGRPPAGSSCRHKGLLWAARPAPLTQGAWQSCGAAEPRTSQAQLARDGQPLQTLESGQRAQENIHTFQSPFCNPCWDGNRTKVSPLVSF